jgi:poly-gamma-glutamate synthesis protein (capsule biosynthesis protein)
MLGAVPLRQVRLDAVGDVMLARWVAKRIDREGAESAFAGVRNEFDRADLVVGNLECALTSAPVAVRKPIVLRADPDKLAVLESAGFAALSLANNHSQDCGAAGVVEARRLLASAKIVPVGPSFDTVVLTRHGLRIGFIGIMDLPPIRLNRFGAWRREISRIREKTDIVVAMLHWGVEGSAKAGDAQRSLAASLAGLGVDLVLGSHPHVLQPLTWLPAPHHRRCLVAFSLGNFLFDARPGSERTSAILSVVLGPSGVVRYREIPVRIDHGFPVLGSFSARPPNRSHSAAPDHAVRPEYKVSLNAIAGSTRTASSRVLRHVSPFHASFNGQRPRLMI